jgi:hypothetical protein
LLEVAFAYIVIFPFREYVLQGLNYRGMGFSTFGQNLVKIYGPRVGPTCLKPLVFRYVTAIGGKEDVIIFRAKKMTCPSALLQGAVV